MNFLLSLRETARVCPNRTHADRLRAKADDLQVALNELHASPTEDTMRRAIAAWTLARKAFDATPPFGGDDGSAGAVRPDEMQRRAA